MRIFNQTLSKTSGRLISSSLIWASLGFIVVAGLSIGYSFIMTQYFNDILQTQGYLIGSSVATVLFVIAAIVMNLFWSFNITNAPWWLITLNWVVYIFLYTGMLAPLITLINNPWVVLMALAITGVCYSLMAVVGYCLLTTKAAMRLSIMLMVGFIAISILQIAFLVPMYLYYSAFQVWYVIYQVVFSILILAMTALSFFNIAKSEYFYQDLTRATRIKVSLFFGLNILNNFVLMFRMILSMFLNFR